MMSPLEALRIFWPSGIPPAGYEKALVLVCLAPGAEVNIGLPAIQPPTSPPPPVQAIAAPPPPASAPKPRPTPKPVQAPIPPKPMPNKKPRGDALKEQVLQFIVDRQPVTGVEMVDHFPVSRTALHEALHKLLDERRISRTAGSGSNASYTYEAVAPGAVPPPPNRERVGSTISRIIPLLESGPARPDELAETLSISVYHARASLERMRAKRRVTRTKNDDGNWVYSLRQKPGRRVGADGGPTQRARALAILEEAGVELTNKDLAGRLGIGANHASALLSSLRAQNLCTSRKDESTGRTLYSRMRPTLPHVPHLNGATKAEA